MLVIASDLHLTDGSSGETVHQGSLRVFRERLRSLAYAASWRAGGKYRPIERLDVLLLGDVIDVLRSSRWRLTPEGGVETVRPWSDPAGGALAAKVDEITAAAIGHNRAFFSLLRELRSSGIASVPTRAANGKPATNARSSAARDLVEVRLHYMAGNHDWYFHLPGAPFTRTRGRLVRALGLENDPAQPFPHSAEEPAAERVRALLEQHRVCARHGDIYDPFNYAGDRNAASLGDAIVIDLLTRFVVEAQHRLRGTLPPACLAALNEIDNVRPLWLAPVWVAEVTRRACTDAHQLRQVQALWNDCASDFLRHPFVCGQLRCGRMRLRGEKLRLVLRMSTQALRGSSGQLLGWLVRRQKTLRPSYARFAAREPALASGAARYVVYGHTHRPEMVTLDAGSVDRLYFNSGAWRPVHELARFSRGAAAFSSFKTITYLAFFQGDERGGRGFEAWSGHLAPAPPRPRCLPESRPVPDEACCGLLAGLSR